MTDVPEGSQGAVDLLHMRALNLRIQLLFDMLGFHVRPVSSLDCFLVSGGADKSDIVDAGNDLEYGACLVETVAAQPGQSTLVAMCANGSPDFFWRRFKAGVDDVLDKSLGDQAVAQALTTAGESSFARLAVSRRRQTCAQLLTDREKEVLRYLVRGHTSREIAKALALSVRTVDVHRAHVQEKLNVRNVAQLAIEYAGLA